MHQMETTIAYVREKIKDYIRHQERVLICFPNEDPAGLGAALEQAVFSIGANPSFWGPDYRWKALLKLAFMTRATAIIGPPQVILGLSKLGKATGTPLYIKCAVLIGTDCTRWMQEDIHGRLDCQIVDCSDISPQKNAAVDEDVCKLAAELLRWSSILDCSLQKSDYGLEMELVTFPGEMLPKLPSCARRITKNWRPDTDVPFCLPSDVECR